MKEPIPSLKLSKTMTDLPSIKEVVECNNSTDANQYLKLGWKLLLTSAQKYKLGWSGQGTAKHPKKLAAQATLDYLENEKKMIEAKLAESAKAKKKKS